MEVSVGSVRFSYEESGAGTPLVLVHGVGSGARSWKAQLEGLSSAFRVIAWDAPGYGGSTALPMAVPDAGHYAARLADLLSALKVDKLHLVGHSLGALTAVRFAVNHPGRVLSLTLASPSGGHARLPKEERKKLRDGRLGDIAELGPRGMAEKRGPRLLTDGASEEQIRSVVETMALVRPEGYAQAVRMLSGGDTRADVARLSLQMPLQFVFGEQDVVTTPASIRLIAEERPQAPVHVIPKAGHAVYIEQPEAFNKLMLQFALR